MRNLVHFGPGGLKVVPRAVEISVTNFEHGTSRAHRKPDGAAWSGSNLCKTVLVGYIAIRLRDTPGTDATDGTAGSEANARTARMKQIGTDGN